MKKWIIVFSVLSVMLLSAAYAQSCWEMDETACRDASLCMWHSDEGSQGWCEDSGCWNYDYTNQSTCEAAGCSWDDPWCEELMCSSFSDSTTCDTSDSCQWQGSGWCEEEGCWTYWDDQTACETSELGCAWDEYGQYCYEPGPWDYEDEIACETADFEWLDGGHCVQMGCWEYENRTLCDQDPEGFQDCVWDSNYQECYELMCWDFDSYSQCVADDDCQWDNYSMECSEKGCWDYNQSECQEHGIFGSGRCTWDAEGEYCHKSTGPWEIQDNDTCIESGYMWETEGMCVDNGCWDYEDSVSCVGDTQGYSDNDCAWDPQGNYCYEEPTDCGNYSDSTICGEHSGEGCTWKDEGGWCESVGCWSYDNTNQSICEAAGCEWMDPWCEEKSCWNLDSESCISMGGCEWQTPEQSGWCEELGCWIYDNDNESCLSANETIGLDCEWDDPWCYENTPGCHDYDGDEQGCKNTNYCVWYPEMDECEEPAISSEGGGGGGGGGGEFMPQNPGCWVLDNSQEYCEKVDGCTYSDGMCDGNEEGIKCVNITNKTFCNQIPMLSTCCMWEGDEETGQCLEKPLSTKCWDNMQPPPTGAMFCDDYNAVNSESMCTQIAGSPWFMPCRWNNVSQKCIFNTESMFGGGGGGFEDIETKKNCEFAGGTWVVEDWFDDNDGKWKTESWCEMGIGQDSCDSSCWACEFQPNGQKWNSTNAARAACENSDLGYCKFVVDQYAPNDQGWCDMKDEMFFGAASCDQDCMSCFAQTKCEGSTAGCKWFTDPADPNNGWCDKNTKKACQNDCWQCYDETTCKNTGLGGGGKCTWDSNNYYCKPANFDNEVCFDGKDNDNNGKIDCQDPYCSFDPYCGGDSLSDCGKYSTEQGCLGDTSGKCIWIQDQMSGASWCGMEGENCWMFQSNESACYGETGCDWHPSDKGFCDINQDKAERCFNYNTRENCQASTDCFWVSEPSSPNGGFCDFKLFQCHGLTKTQCGSGDYSYCGWIQDKFSPDGGFCEPICFTDGLNPKDGNNNTCVSNANCEWIHGRCEPDMINMEECFMHDGDETACLAAESCAWHDEDLEFCDVDKSKNCPSYETNATCEGQDGCTWMVDERGNAWCENVMFACFQYDGTDQATCESSGPCEWLPEEGGLCDPVCFALDGGECLSNPACTLSSGFCDPKMVGEMFEGMESGEPVMIVMDGPDGDNMYLDIMGIGLKEMPDSYGFGIGVNGMPDAAVCNGQPTMFGKGSGYETAKFYLYLDTDGKDSNNCDSKDGEESGFEFYLKYETKWADGGLVETKVTHKCANGSWVPTPIPISTWKKVMCQEINGGMLAVDKSTLKKFKQLFNVTQSMRIYGATAGASTDAGEPIDTAGPGYYTPGSADFKFEDCMAMGVDMDGDGFTSENDPDCMDFQRFGYQPFEFDCADTIDNNGDGLVDCADPMCAQKPHCSDDGFSFQSDNTDKKAPKVVFQKVDRFVDGAFIAFDTDEPATGTVFFYNNTQCIADPANRTLYDLGDPDVSYDDYKPFHGVMIDNYCDNPNGLGYDLENATTYSYKYKVCDPSDNCGTSACMNFTTRAVPREFIFSMDVPEGFQPKFDDNDFQGGKKLNETEARRKNITIDCPTAGYSIKFVRASVKGAKTLNLSSVVCDATNDLIGLDSQLWNEIVSALGPEYVLVTWATGGDTATVEHCDSDGENCEDVTEYLDCTVTDTSVTCKVPVTLGFSAYKVTTDTDDGNNNGGGGGGGGGAIPGPKNPSQTRVWTLVAKGERAEMQVEKPEIPVSRIRFRARVELRNGELKVEQHSGVPEGLDVPRGKVFKYLEFTPVDLEVEDVEIDFKVNKSWIQENNLDPRSVVMLRFNETWQELETSYKGDDTGVYYYSAQSPGFSYFAVKGEEAQPEETAEETQQPGTEEEQPTEQTPDTESEVTEPEQDQETTEAQESKVNYYFLAAAVLLAVVTVALYFERKKHSK